LYKICNGAISRLMEDPGSLLMTYHSTNGGLVL